MCLKTKQIKKLLILLFVPFVSFGQDFNDLKQINSEKQFKRVMFENGYVQFHKEVFMLQYGLNYSASKKYASVWAYFYHNSGKLAFQLVKKSDNSPNEIYISILEQVKQECTFYDFYENIIGEEYICYTCTNSKYTGKIGFRRGDDGLDYIETFIFD